MGIRLGVVSSKGNFASKHATVSDACSGYDHIYDMLDRDWFL